MAVTALTGNWHHFFHSILHIGKSEDNTVESFCAKIQYFLKILAQVHYFQAFTPHQETRMGLYQPQPFLAAEATSVFISMSVYVCIRVCIQTL